VWAEDALKEAPANTDAQIKPKKKKKSDK
jgi:hypothetical protein